MTPKDMMVVDANAEALGIPRSSLMENAGRCVAYRIFHRLKPCKVVIFAGSGGNGGDGFVAARYLLNKGFEVEIFLLNHPSRIKSDEARKNWDVLQKISTEINSLKMIVLEDSYDLQSTDVTADVMMDAILGTGVKGNLREPISSAVDIINNFNGLKVAVDVPTGLDPLTGKVFDKSVEADITVTFHKVKIGLQDAKKDQVGEIHLCDIGIPLQAELFTGPGDLLRLKNRNITSHKGQNGTTLVIGGSIDYSGAPAIAALSSLRSGTDLALIACPAPVSPIIKSYTPDFIVKSLVEDFISPKDVDEILELSKNADSVIIGCGMGLEAETLIALNQLLPEFKKPLVIDADALKMLDINYIKKLDNEVVLTPHKAEFKALFGIDVPDILDKRIKTVRKAAMSCGCTVLLKGPVDVVAQGDRLRLNSTGNPGMTVGGTGDCLSGLVGGLMAQGYSAFEAAYLGAYINGRAGDLAFKKFGYNFTTTDLLSNIPQAFQKIN